MTGSNWWSKWWCCCHSPNGQQGGHCWGTAHMGLWIQWEGLVGDGELLSGGEIGDCWAVFLQAGHCKILAWGVRPQGGGVLPANFLEEVLEIIALCGGDGACPHVTCFVAADADSFAVNKPAHTHDSGVVPFGMTPCALSGKVMLPDFTFLHSEFIDQDGVFRHAFFVGVVQLLFLTPLFNGWVVLSGQNGCGVCLIFLVGIWWSWEGGSYWGSCWAPSQWPGQSWWCGHWPWIGRCTSYNPPASVGCKSQWHREIWWENPCWRSCKFEDYLIAADGKNGSLHAHHESVFLGQRGSRCVVSPYAHARDAAWQEEEEEHTDSNLRKGDYQEKEKGVA